MKIFNRFKLLIIFKKKLYFDKVLNTPLQKQPVERCSGNRCSEICSQNPSKIPMKKLIFSKVAG